MEEDEVDLDFLLALAEEVPEQQDEAQRAAASSAVATKAQHTIQTTQPAQLVLAGEAKQPATQVARPNVQRGLGLTGAKGQGHLLL